MHLAFETGLSRNRQNTSAMTVKFPASSTREQETLRCIVATPHFRGHCKGTTQAVNTMPVIMPSFFPAYFLKIGPLFVCTFFSRGSFDCLLITGNFCHSCNNYSSQLFRFLSYDLTPFNSFKSSTFGIREAATLKILTC